MIAVRRPSDPDEVYEDLAEANPEAMVADGFEDAYIGYTVGAGRPTLAVYDYALCVDSLMAREGWSREEAIEYLEFNTVSAYVGENTPVFLVRRQTD